MCGFGGVGRLGLGVGFGLGGFELERCDGVVSIIWMVCWGYEFCVDSVFLDCVGRGKWKTRFRFATSRPCGIFMSVRSGLK